MVHSTYISTSGNYLEAQNLAQRFGVAEWVWIVGFVSVLLIVWWLLSRAANLSAEESQELSIQINEDSDQPVEPDDLTRIEGIGPKISSLLQEAGFDTFSKLADADVESIVTILKESNLTIADPTSWPEQAALAANGNWEQLEELQNNLKGGRKA